MDRNDRYDESRARGSVSRDAAGIGPHNREGVRLTSMRELDGFRVAEGDADIRGWEVRTLGGRELGKVADLLVDTTTNEVVMLDVDLAGTDQHTLAPVRAAQLDRTRRVVLLDSADLEDTNAVPTLRRGATTDEEARHFGDRYNRAYGPRGYDRDRDWQVQRGDHDLEFRRRDLAADTAVPLAASREVDAQREAEVMANAQRREAAREEREAREAEQRRADEQRLAEQRRADEQQRLDAQRQADPPRGLADQPPGAAGSREVRFAGTQQHEEIVVERRPVIEEVIIRRRVVDPDSPEARNLGAGNPGATDPRHDIPRDGAR